MPGETGGRTESWPEPRFDEGERRSPASREHGEERFATEKTVPGVHEDGESLHRRLGALALDAEGVGRPGEAAASDAERSGRTELASRFAALEAPSESPEAARFTSGEGVRGVHRDRVEPGRYRDPGESVREDLERSVDGSPREGDWERWIDRVNPNYDGPFSSLAEQRMWRGNCGDCSRSFADTYQGVETRAAWGDERAGEYDEMWDWAGARPDEVLRNDDVPRAGEFTDDAWRRAEAALRDEPVDSVAIIGVGWEDRHLIPDPDGRRAVSGHFFNAVVREDGLHWVDAQSGETDGWPPGYGADIRSLEAVVRRPGRGWEGVRL